MSLAHHSPHHSSGLAELKMLGMALLLILIAMLVSASDYAIPDADGEKLFKQVCTTCHSVDPPTDMETKPIAPPMKMIMRHYIAAHDTKEEVHASLVSWLEEPAPERSALPAHAIEKHGLMPVPNLNAEERVAVTDYIMTLIDGDVSGKMKGMMQKKAEGDEGCKMKQGEKEGKKEHKMMMKKKNSDN
ncbi:MAG TPA: hypothetical protein DCY57_11975 [Bacteroidetes bacterium]|nr:hypothetical protein [Bacteroidota bacterium]